jgi:excisionase family DNA binding protein
MRRVEGAIGGSVKDSPVQTFEPLLNDNEASALLGIHPKTLQRLARSGAIPSYRVGRFWRYRASDLDVWVRSQAQSRRQPVARVDFTRGDEQ